MIRADFTLSKSHGFYLLAPNSDSAKVFVAEIAARNDPYIGTDYSREYILLDSFFAFAADWCRCNVLPRGLSVQWGDDFYSGKSGIDALWEIAA